MDGAHGGCDDKFKRWRCCSSVSGMGCELIVECRMKWMELMVFVIHDEVGRYRWCRPVSTMVAAWWSFGGEGREEGCGCEGRDDEY